MLFRSVKNRSGDVLGRVAGRPAAIITFLDGMWIRRPTADHCAALGETLAKLHLAGLDFPLRPPEEAIPPEEMAASFAAPTAVFGPQKGVTSAQLPRFDEALARFARRAEAAIGRRAAHPCSDSCIAARRSARAERFWRPAA